MSRTLIVCSLLCLTPFNLPAKKTQEEKEKIVNAVKQVTNAAADLAVAGEDEDKIVQNITNIFGGALQFVSLITRSMGLSHYRSLSTCDSEELIALIMADPELRALFITCVKERQCNAS